MTCPASQAFIHWPGLDTLRSTSGLALFFLGFFYLFYGGAAWLADFLPWRLNAGFDWEKTIPFIPESAFIYTSLCWLMLLILFVIRDAEEIRLLVRVLCIQTVIGALFFILVPASNNFPPRYGSDALPQIFLIADTLNLRNNELPSLHVCFAFTTALVLSHYAGKRQTFLLFCWAVAIAVSAMTIHEHNLLDLAGGMLLAVWGARYWRRLTLRASIPLGEPAL
jgi:membrane-associated phospholipid phosphatase